MNLNNSARQLCTLTILALLLIPTAITRADDTVDIATKARHVLNKHCARCHFSDNGSFNILDDKDLVESGRVDSGSPDDSYLFEMVVKNRMPPKAVLQRPTAEEGEVLRQWILQNTPAFPTPGKRPFLKLQTVLQNVLDYQRKAEHRDDAIWFRFFTLHNVYNNPRVFDVELNTYRAALSKAVNSLSWSNRIVVPKAIDEEQTLFVIDIRDYSWDKGDKWSDILAEYPYGLDYSNLEDKTLDHINKDVVRMADDCGLPMIRADWFIATATRPPLYHTLLDIPETAGELEHRLGVNVARNFLDPKTERIARSGFHQSRVSEQNRLLERHDAAYGFYWKSYDFLPSRFESKLTRFPLGPLNLFSQNRHPFANQAFIHDGGEIIFGLPNGLQGYMLIDGKDERIDEGPIAVVSDSLKTSGTPAIVNGVSCISCHKNGMLWFQDSIRDHSAVFGRAEDHVKRLFPEQDEMDALVTEDESRFLTALKKCVGPFLQTGLDEETDIKDLAEPVGEVARWHRSQFLDIKTIACELDLEDPQELLIKVGEKNLKKLGLEALLKSDGVLSRMEWESRRGATLMQELAHELRFTPYSVR